MRDALVVQNVQFAYPKGKPVLKGVSFSLPEGSVIGLVGDSGCGKSTLCGILCGMIPYIIGGDLYGDAEIFGEHLRDMTVAEIVKKVGFVMQDPDRMIVSSTVEDELAFGPEGLCLPPEEIQTRVDDVLKLLKIEELRLTDPNHLSGGQKQRVALGSVLTCDPGLIIMDEPFSALDREGRKNLKAIIQTLSDQGKTILIVEHDYDNIDFADQWIWLKDGVVAMADVPAKVRPVIEEAMNYGY